MKKLQHHQRLCNFPPNHIILCLVLAVAASIKNSVSVSSSTDTTSSTVPVEEIEALLEFKAHLTFASQVLRLHTWDRNTSTSVCGGSWLGVQCTTSCDSSCRAHVQSIDLHGLDLTGTIAPDLGNLSMLTVLDLSFSYLSGPIPAELSHATSLEELRLQYNQLTGSLPYELTLLQQLTVMDLSHNQLTGPIPHILTNWTNMIELDLSFNKFVGTIPIQISLLQRLTRLSLHHNSLPGSVPTDLGNCTSLSILELSSNQLTDVVPPSLGELELLLVMDLSENHLEGGIPGSLGNCNALTNLNLSHNQFNGVLPESLSGLSSLTSLDVSSNNLSGQLPPYLESMQSLRFLNISFNDFTGIIPSLGVFKLLNGTSFMGNPQLLDRTQNPLTNTQHQMPSLLIAAIAICCTSVLSFTLILCNLCRDRKIGRIHSAEARGCTAVGLLKEPRRFTADELLKATGGYSEDNIIGEGGISLVYKGMLANGEVIAVKKLKEVTSKESLLKEIHTLSRLRHRNIISIIGCVFNLDVNAIVMKYMSNGSLEQYLRHHRNEMTWNMLFDVIISVANALIYLHHEYGTPIIHGDVKPSNILLDDDYVVHLADFGIAKLQMEGALSMSSSNVFKGSIGYMAPEFAYGARATIKRDVYSFGVVLLELLTCKKPTQFMGGVTLHSWVEFQMNKGLSFRNFLARSLMYDPRIDIDRFASQLLEIGLACTNEHPKNRPSMQDIISPLLKIKNKLQQQFAE